MKGYFVSNVMKIVRKLELTAKAVHVYFYLAECSNINGECWPSKKTIAEACKISVATVTRALRELEKAGMVISEPRRRLNNGQTSNRYTVFTEPQITEPSGQPAGMGKMEDTKQDVIDLPYVEKACEQLEIPEYISDVPADLPTGENPTENTAGRQKQNGCHEIPHRQKNILTKPLSTSCLLKLRRTMIGYEIEKASKKTFFPTVLCLRWDECLFCKPIKIWVDLDLLYVAAITDITS